MPTYRKVVNSALQYNQNDLSDYLVSQLNVGKKFLTECPLSRNIRLSELSALYFLVENSGTFNASCILKYKDDLGNLLYEKIITFFGESQSVNPIAVHNAIPINFSNQNPFYVPSGAKTLSVLLSSNTNRFNNPEFTLGSGSTFTNWTNSGTITESLSGGPDGTRCPILAYNSSVSQSIALSASTTYVVKIMARTSALYSNSVIKLLVDNVEVDETELISNSYGQYTLQFTNVSAGTKSIKFTFINEELAGTCFLDDVSIRLATEPTAMTEERTFILDEECAIDEKQVVWMNKLGGFDSWTFLAGQETQISVKRENTIEYSKEINFHSPHRINSNRNNDSVQSKTLATRVNKEVSDWLKSELINSIDVYFVENGSYIPVNVKDTSVAYNSWSKNYIVKMAFEYAYPINIQTR